jgi:hypothetical protein
MVKHIKVKSTDLPGPVNTPKVIVVGNDDEMTAEQHEVLDALLEDHSMQAEVDVMGAIMEQQARVQHGLKAPEWRPRRKPLPTDHIKDKDFGVVTQRRKALKKSRRKASKKSKQRNR